MTQMMDEARHMEVSESVPSPAGEACCTPARPGVGTEGDPRVAEPHPGTFLLNVLAKGLSLRFSGREYLSNTHVDKEISGAACRTRPVTCRTGPWN